ncbi:DeoR family transcriptional regulator [Prevotella communis]|uniref:DeoR family transcriptional regulator n=1 Tax=Prevotella communis TaxID=2913614 RepID=UPI00353177E6
MNNVTSDVSSNVGSLSVVQLTERQKKIREIILKDSYISTQQMSVVLSVVKRTVERDLADLQKKGVLIREGDNFIPTSSISLILQLSHPNPVR